MNIFRFPPFWALLVGALIFCWSSWVQAETCSGSTCTQPATPKTAGQVVINAVQGYSNAGAAGYPNDSFDQACNATRVWAGNLAKGACTDAPSVPWTWNNGGNAGICYYNNYGTNCAGMTSWSVTAGYRCPADYTGGPQAGQCTNSITVYECPSTGGWTLSGQTCSRPNCQVGQYLQDGVCKCDNGSQIGTNGTCCPAPGSGGGAPMQWCYVDGPTASNCTAGGQNGCAVRCNNVTYQKGTGAQLEIYPKQALGQACGYTGLKTPAGVGGGDMTNEQLKEVSEATKNPEVAKTPQGCLAAGMGYLTSGGVTSCVGGGEGGEVKKVETAKTVDTVKNPATGADETTTNETAKSETTNSDGTKTSTVSETVTNPNGTKTVTTTTKTQNKDGTVTEAKKVETVAVDGSKTTQSDKSGTEGTGTWCEKNPNDPICKKESDECKLYPDRIGCMDQGGATPEQGGALQTSQIGVSALTVVTVASNNQCPTGATLPRNLGVYNWEPICDFAGALKPIVLAFAWLAAGLLVIGGIKT